MGPGSNDDHDSNDHCCDNNDAQYSKVVRPGGNDDHDGDDDCCDDNDHGDVDDHGEQYSKVVRPAVSLYIQLFIA